MSRHRRGTIGSTRRAARRRRRRWRLGAAAAVAAAAPASLFAVDSDGDAHPVVPRDAVRVELGGPAGRPVPAGFVGLSLEYNSLLAYAGSNPAAPNPTFIRLVRALAPGGSPQIRFGGDTTDWEWWPTAAAPKPPGARFQLTPRWLAVARASAQASGARYVLGINLEADSRIIAGTEARVLLNGLGRGVVAGFELGNEPEVYGTIGWYTNSAGTSVPGRSAGYDFQSYLADYAAIGSSLPHGVPLAGPASGAPNWIAGARQFAAANPRVRILTYHAYPLRRCYTPSSSPTYPTIGNLLTARAASSPARSFAGAIALAHSRGLQFRVDEINSVSCKGTSGVSDVFASALWVVDDLFHLARAGADGVNVHTLTAAPYAPFAFTRVNRRWQAQVRPLYYGLLLFNRAAPPGSRLVATFHSPQPQLRTWATAGPGRVTRVALLNDSATRPLTVAIRAVGVVRSASLERLVASGLRARTGVRLAGQTFGAATATGALPGAPRAVALQPIQRRYVIRLQPASAALLTMTG